VGTTERPDTWEVQGRGELQLAVLVETMRREGFELTVGKPQVVTREIDGKLHEPMERVAIDVPDDYLGVVTQLMALRKGLLIEMVNHGTGWVRMDYRVPARGLVGFRTEFMTETRGTGMLHHVFDGWEPWHGELKTKRNGSMVADRRGPRPPATPDEPAGARRPAGRPGHRGLRGHGDRRERPGRGDGRQPDQGEEADQHPVRLRRRGHPPHPSAAPLLEQALEFISDDECVEVTPKAVRLRKVVLDQATRGRQRSRARKAAG
jgi:GTP-binding protein